MNVQATIPIIKPIKQQQQLSVANIHVCEYKALVAVATTSLVTLQVSSYGTLCYTLST